MFAYADTHSNDIKGISLLIWLCSDEKWTQEEIEKQITERIEKESII
jgi:hypothetical protein